MTTCNDLDEILNNPEKENIKIELKKSDLLKNGEGQKKIGYSIIALANRYGGKLILGINDDGSFEGKNIFDIDNDKSKIDNICHQKISPIVEYDIEFLECQEGDILIVNIPKRKGIPHAYIINRDGPEIKNRIYYIRTSHGKRLVSDSQLEWLFNHQEDPDIVFPFRIIFNFSRDSLAFPNLYNPNFHLDLWRFTDKIPEKDIEMLTNDWKRLRAFFIEITPYVLLFSFSHYFSNSWLIKIERYGKRTSIKPLSNSIESKKISFNDLPEPTNDTIIKSLSWDFHQILKDIFSQDFHIPVNSELQIQYCNNGNKSMLSLNHEDFNINVVSKFSIMNSGLQYEHPINSALMDYEIVEQNELTKRFQSIEMDCMLDVSFNFPEKEIDLFKDYLCFAKLIKEILENDYDYDQYLQNFPHYKIFTIDNKLNDILKYLISRNRNE